MESAKTIHSEVDLNQIVIQIEQQTEKMVVLGHKTGQLVTPDKLLKSDYTSDQLKASINLLQGIMQQGSNDFEKRVGRPMTYSEMRAMYG
jgi:hypothetical protein